MRLDREAWRTLALLLAGVLLLATPAHAESALAEHGYIFPEIQRAYDEGGEKQVKAWMKAMLKRVKKSKQRLASGAKPKCGACHDNLKTYPLSDNAVDDLRAILAAEAATP